MIRLDTPKSAVLVLDDHRWHKEDADRQSTRIEGLIEALEALQCVGRLLPLARRGRSSQDRASSTSMTLPPDTPLVLASSVRASVEVLAKAEGSIGPGATLGLGSPLTVVESLSGRRSAVSVGQSSSDGSDNTTVNESVPAGQSLTPWSSIQRTLLF